MNHSHMIHVAGRGRRWVRPVLGLAAVTLLLTSAMIGTLHPNRIAAQGAGTPPPFYEPPATVTVSGRGTVRLEPDTATFTAGVTVTQETLAGAQAEATGTMGLIIEAVKAAGVADEDIQTVNFNVNILYRYDQNGNPERIEGYQVSNQVAVKVRDLEKLGELLDAVVTAGANTIYGISFYVEDTGPAASQARAQAVADARAKADEMAAAAGVTIGRVLSMSESSAPPPMPQVFAGAADAAATAAAPASSRPPWA